MISFVSSFSSLGLRLKSIFLLSLSFWSILSKQLHELTLLVLLDALGEDVEDWWALQSHEKHSLLSLDSNILWPLDISRQVSGWLNVSSNSEVSFGLLEERSASARLRSSS